MTAKTTTATAKKPIQAHHGEIFQNLAPLTVQRYGWILDNFLQWCAEHGVNPVSPKVREITDYLQDRPQWGVSRKTVALAALRHWFDYCLADGKSLAGGKSGLTENPARAASLRKTGRAGRAFAPKRLPAALDDTESAAFLRVTAPDPSDSVPVRRKHLIQRLMFWTGLRVSEAVNLQVGDIRLDDEHPVLRVIGKGNKERQVPIADRLAMELQDYLEMRDGFLDARTSANVFCDRYGNAYTPAGVWSMVKATLKDIGAEKRHMGPHVLRHTFATRQLQSGHPPAIVKAWMGHSDLRVLFSVYEHVMNSPKGVKPVE
jgi:site-specific recombinase XerD